MAGPKVKILIGADPEIFLRDKKTGQFVAAKIPGTKLEPYKVDFGAVQVDGTAAEINIDPAEGPSTFIRNINEVLSKVREFSPNTDLVFDPTATFDPTYFSTLPVEARELGCNPDFNAWTEQVNPAPDGESTTMRTASGHIHLGWCKNVNPTDKIHIQDCHTVVKQMDYYVGLPSLLWDPDNKRRQLYGMAGACRYKPYGVEYRVPSNVWLRTREMQAWVWDASYRAVMDLLDPDKRSMETIFGDYARRMIDENRTDWLDTSEGRKVWATMKINMPPYEAVLDKYYYAKKPEPMKMDEADVFGDPKPKRKKVANFTYRAA